LARGEGIMSKKSQRAKELHKVKLSATKKEGDPSQVFGIISPKTLKDPMDGWMAIWQTKKKDKKVSLSQGPLSQTPEPPPLYQFSKNLFLITK
jgi:hypothetical protein